MASVVVTMSGDEAQLWKAQQKVFEQQEKIRKKYEGITKSSGVSAKAAKEEAAARAQAEKEHQKELRKGKALTESLRTPQERYNEAIKEAASLKEKGAISATTYGRRVEQLKAELRDATGESARNTRVEKARQEVIARSGTLSKQAQDAIKRYAAELRNLDRAQKAGKISAEELAAKQSIVKQRFRESVGIVGEQNGLIGKASGMLGGYATAAGGAAAAVGAIRAAWRTVIEEQEKGLAALQKTEDTERRLRQISKPEEFIRRRDLAQQLSLETGVDVRTTQSVLFSAISENFKDVYADIIRAVDIVDPEAAAGVAGQFPALFKGDVKPLEAVNLLLDAARNSKLDFEDMARIIPTIAEGTSDSGASVEETLALASVLPSEFSSGEKAADRIKAFATSVAIDQGGVTPEDFQKKLEAEQSRVARAEKQLRSKEERVADLERRVAASSGRARESAEIQLKRAQRDLIEFDRSQLRVNAPKGRESLAGLGVIDAAKALRDMSNADRRDFLGSSQELNVAYNKIIANIDLLEAREQQIRAERQAFNSGRGILRDSVATVTDPQSVARRENRIAAARLEASERGAFGVQGANASTASMQASELLNENGSFSERVVGNSLGLAGLASRAAVALGFENDTAADVGRQTASIFASPFSGPNGFNKVAQEMREAAREQKEASRDLKQATANLANQPPPLPPSQINAARRQASRFNQGD